MGFEVFSATHATRHRLGRVLGDVFDHPLQDAALDAYLAAPHLHMVCAHADEAVIGQARAVLIHRPDGPAELFLDNLGVAPAWHRRGVATALVRAQRAWGAARGADVLWVATEPDNDAANAFYMALGLRRSAAHIFEGACA